MFSSAIQDYNIFVISEMQERIEKLINERNQLKLIIMELNEKLEDDLTIELRAQV